jgi:signal peptidase I
METKQEIVAETTNKKKKDKPKKTVMQEIMSWVWTILAALVIACLIRAFVFEPIRVDGHSMDNTLANNEIVFCSKLDYLFGQPQRGDVVICRYPGRMSKVFDLGAGLALDDYTLFVKRLVALPGDTVAVMDGKLYVNDVVVSDPQMMGSAPLGSYPRTQLGEDEYFVMGDNRGNSHDSRSSDVGPISRGAIMGHVRCVLFPFSRIRGVE